MPTSFDFPFEFSPWRLSGVIYGTLLNDPAALAALGESVDAPPYKAPPKAPALYLKPRNTLATSGACFTVPAEAEAIEIGAALGIVIGRSACRVSAATAMDHVAGWTLVADLSIAHDSFYRPSVRLKARDGSCLIGPQVVPRSALPDPDSLEIGVAVDGKPVHTARTAGMRRSVAELLQDVSDFMTLHPGDVLLLGVSAGAPRVGAAHSFTIEAVGLGCLEGRLVAEPAKEAA